MAWIVRLNSQSEEFLSRLDPKQQRLVAKAIDQMRDDPFAGNVIPLRLKKWKGFYRKRVGRYRIKFLPDRKNLVVRIQDISIRSESTYR